MNPSPCNPEFGQEISKIRPKIVPPKIELGFSRSILPMGSSLINSFQSHKKTELKQNQVNKKQKLTQNLSKNCKLNIKFPKPTKKNIIFQTFQ